MRLFFTGINDVVDAIVGFFLAPGVDGVRGILLLTEIYRFNIRTKECLEILLVFLFYRIILADKQFVSELQSNILNILQEYI